MVPTLCEQRGRRRSERIDEWARLGKISVGLSLLHGDILPTALDMGRKMEADTIKSKLEGEPPRTAHKRRRRKLEERLHVKDPWHDEVLLFMFRSSALSDDKQVAMYHLSTWMDGSEDVRESSDGTSRPMLMSLSQSESRDRSPFSCEWKGAWWQSVGSLAEEVSLVSKMFGTRGSGSARHNPKCEDQHGSVPQSRKAWDSKSGPARRFRSGRYPRHSPQRRDLLEVFKRFKSGTPLFQVCGWGFFCLHPHH